MHGLLKEEKEEAKVEIFYDSDWYSGSFFTNQFNNKDFSANAVKIIVQWFVFGNNFYDIYLFIQSK